jgi:hypothetical protein
VEAKRTKLADGPEARSFLNPGGPLLCGEPTRVTVMTLACLDANPGSDEALDFFLRRAVDTSGIKEGVRSSFDVCTDMGCGRLVRKILADPNHPYAAYFACVVFSHGLLHAMMHMLAAWRLLAGPFTTKEFAACFGRNTDKAKEALAAGKTAYHDKPARVPPGVGGHHVRAGARVAERVGRVGSGGGWRRDGVADGAGGHG